MYNTFQCTVYLIYTHKIICYPRQIMCKLCILFVKIKLIPNHHVGKLQLLPRSHRRVVVSTPVAWRWSDCPAVCCATMRSLHCASSSTTATGFVHKSRSDNSVGMCVQLKRCCVVSQKGMQDFQVIDYLSM